VLPTKPEALPSSGGVSGAVYLDIIGFRAAPLQFARVSTQTNSVSSPIPRADPQRQFLRHSRTLEVCRAARFPKAVQAKED